MKQVRRVLILNTLGQLSSPGIALMDQAIVDGLRKSPYQIELYTEDMEATLFPDEAVQRQFREWYIHKYHDRKPDAIIAVGVEPLKFMIDSHEKVFSGIPIIFCGTTREMLGQLRLGSDFTGVWSVAQPEKTLNAALALLPETKNVVVVGGVGEYDRYLESIAKAAFGKYESRFQFTYLTELEMPELLQRLNHLPDHTIVYHTSIMQDAAGTRFIDANQSVPMIVGAANAPVFVVDDVDLGKGTVGGYLLSFAEIGKTVAELSVRVLNGERPQDIPIVNSPNMFMFDWLAMRRWGSKESALPPGSLVLNRQPALWETFRWYILGGTALILLEGLLIFALIWQRSIRKKVEVELGVTNDRLRLAMISGKSVAWDLDVKTGRDRWFGDLQTMFGIQADAHAGDIEDFYRRVYAEDRQFVAKAVADAKQNRNTYKAEFRVVREDGSVRWISAGGKFNYAHNGDAERMLGIAVDITDRKQAENAVRESEQRFQLVANTAPVLIWMAGNDMLCTYVNRPWLEFTGRSLEAELGSGWLEGVHPDDVETCQDTYTKSFDRREPFQMQYRLRRHDGEYRWLLDTGVPRFSPDRTFAGYIGSCMDITDRKFAEEAMASVGRRLIEAHEQERRWIARELHDDINQQIALLSIELDRWGHEQPSAGTDAHIRHVNQRLSDIAKEVQALSHRLHSSKLEYLGIAAAAKSFCRELSEQQKVQVEFFCSAIPHNVPNEIALCLFRVLQEALQNAVKHSGAREFHVELCGAPEEILLTVRDPGVGFDWHGALDRQGLGLISMSERLQLVNGNIEIESKPGAGTSIHARVPLRAEEFAAKAG